MELKHVSLNSSNLVIQYEREVIDNLIHLRCSDGVVSVNIPSYPQAGEDFTFVDVGNFSKGYRKITEPFFGMIFKNKGVDFISILECRNGEEISFKIGSYKLYIGFQRNGPARLLEIQWLEISRDGVVITKLRDGGSWSLT